MQVSVYVLVEVERGEPWRIASEISRVEGVKTAHVVTGQYDIIVYAEIDRIETLKDLIRSIHSINGVQRTQTAVCIP